MMLTAVLLLAADKPVKKIKIVSREAWGAKPARAAAFIHQTPKMITIHHTAAPYARGDNPPAQLRSIQAQHMNGSDTRWPDLAYHYLIDHHGVIYQGRPVDVRGDSRTNYDLQDKVLVCLMGNFENQRPTPEQLASLTDLLVFLMQRYQVPLAAVSTHRQHASTLCPGKYLQELWDNGYLPGEVRKKSEQYLYQLAP